MSTPLIEKNIHSLGDFIEQNMHQYADSPAFHCFGQTLSFKEVEAKSRALACWLQQKTPLKPGDRIAIQLPNIIQYPVAAYAALRAGLVLVNTNPLYTPREMQHQFKDSGAKAIIILRDLLPKLNEIKVATEIKTIIVTTADDFITGDIVELKDSTCLNQAIAQGLTMNLRPRVEQDLDTVCVLQYTGGTTGVSKGAVLTHRNILSNTGQVLERLGDYCQPSKEIFICPLPLYHIYAFTVNMMLFFGRGNLNILIPNPRNIDAFVQGIKTFKFTGFAGINTLFVGLCQHPEFKALDFSHLKLTISGGTALTIDATDTWHGITGCSITEGYGLSETSPVLCLNQPQHEQLGTVGLPVINTEIELRNENNYAVSDGEEGEIVARGPQIMHEYWQRAAETAQVMTTDGFFKTGDVGVRLANGCIKIVDRLKDMIIVSGFNVYPNEVEGVLVSHENIIEAAVVGEPDEKSGERVVCYITVENDMSEQLVLEHCREQLTAYKIPKKVIVLKELPKSSVGKILRKKLRNHSPISNYIEEVIHRLDSF